MRYFRKNDWLNIEINNEISLKSFVKERYFNKGIFQRLINEKKVMINDKIITSINIILNVGDVLAIKCFNIEYVDYAASHYPLTILYEDDFILVVDKPNGIIIHDDDKNKLDTLNNYVASYYVNTNQNVFVRPIHRLDKETCGCIIYSKCSLIQPYYDNLIMNKKIKRDYYAIVNGKINFENKHVEIYISSSRHHNNKMIVSKNGKLAITDFTLKRYYPKLNISLLKCELSSGRKHQIRVTCKYLGYSIINDIIYGKRDKRFDQMLLCAYHVKIPNLFSTINIDVYSHYKNRYEEMEDR